MTLEQVFTLINAGYTKEEINAFTQTQVQPTPTPAQVQPTPAQVQPTPAQVQPTPTPAQVQPTPTPAQVQPTPTPAQVQPTPINQPVNAAGTTERLLNIIEELQKSNLRLASGQSSTATESAEDALLSIIQETKGGNK